MTQTDDPIATVRRIVDITPNMRRITFGGPALEGFPTGAEGGYVKLVFSDLPRTNPNRPVMRTYSVRSHDPQAQEIEVDFAMHADTGGLAMDWALAAQPGDGIPLKGPGTIKMAPPDADWYLIAGDMTALPAASCNLERLPEHAKGYAVLEVTSDADRQALRVPSGIDLQWIVNPDPSGSKSMLLDAVQRLPWLEGTPFVWTACEFDTMRALRSYYRTDRGLDKGEYYLSSYWRAGRTEDQHKVDKRQDAEATK